MNLVFLPATAPDDDTYGVIPESVTGWPDATIHSVYYPELVWYNKRVCAEAVAQIRGWDITDIVLIGFSKSGLGAWNIAGILPDRVACTIIFDSPAARQRLPNRGTAPFYSNDAEWQEDLPFNNIDHFHRTMPASHQLILVSGPGFAAEMQQLSDALNARGSEHTFLSPTEFTHHWNSGWIEASLREIT